MDPLSPRNPRVQAVRRLARQARERADRRAFVVEGPVLVAEAIDAGLVIEALLHTPGADPELIEQARGRDVDTVAVSQAAMERMATTVAPQSVMAVVETPAGDTLAELAERPGHIVVLERLQDPGNAGTILRSAEASGAAGVVFGTESVDPNSPKVVRASAGSRFRVPIVDAVEVADVVAELQSAGRTAYGTAAEATAAYDEVDLTDAVIVMGNEAAGLSASTRASLDGAVRIPQTGRAESLNVAMAATVLCFEAARQRRAAR